ncbi:expressed protein [Echinococcus multilocularis]|uniref:Expressed protein n=1 Tax=Echinococcus multilocularis TaxID=6211 RepID=A0A087VZK0_ECHMU|nr:expressed protein [Echinococcus multilocularis]
MRRLVPLVDRCQFPVQYSFTPIVRCSTLPIYKIVFRKLVFAFFIPFWNSRLEAKTIVDGPSGVTDPECFNRSSVYGGGR